MYAVKLLKEDLIRKQWWGKFRKTIGIAFRIILARQFGRYVHTVYDGQFEYAVYVWRKKEYMVPTQEEG